MNDFKVGMSLTIGALILLLLLYFMDVIAAERPLPRNYGHTNLKSLFDQGEYPSKKDTEPEIARLLKKVSTSSQTLLQQLRKRHTQIKKECPK
jgi:hypothetical protein